MKVKKVVVHDEGKAHTLYSTWGISTCGIFYNPLVYSKAGYFIFFVRGNESSEMVQTFLIVKRYHSQDPKACCTRLSTLELTVEIAMQTPAGVVPTLA